MRSNVFLIVCPNGTFFEMHSNADTDDVRFPTGCRGHGRVNDVITKIGF
jgi:hypothetical protein